MSSFNTFFFGKIQTKKDNHELKLTNITFKCGTKRTYFTGERGEQTYTKRKPLECTGLVDAHQYVDVERHQDVMLSATSKEGRVLQMAFLNARIFSDFPGEITIQAEKVTILS